MAATPVPTVTPNPTIRNHNPLDIIITNRKCRYTSGDSITGKVAISLPDEVIESMEVSLVGLCETEIVTKQSGYRSPNLTSIRSQDKLVDIVKPITHDSTETADGFWPFEFIVPEFTNTLAKYSSQQTSRKFATQRHLLPPSFMQRDSSGNMAQVVYGILARMHRSTRNLEPYTHWVEVKVGTAHEHQEVPSPVRHDLKLVIKRFSRNRTPQTLFAKIRDILCFKTSSVPRICLEPTIFLPDQIIPGHQLPFTILLTPRPQRPADLSKPKVTLNSLKVVLREQTSILKQTSRRCRVDKPLDLGQMQISLEDQYVGIRPLILEQERTQSIFKQLYNIDDSLLPNIKTFILHPEHDDPRHRVGKAGDPGELGDIC
ncbi:hypothetical protein SLS56_009855 [Neofusicoccum ribis]|uniref:Arrestin-like N-terminal domain-containing protein n=1 Tax=Neofusicoccum ribis TaxID=45134 RepID=A0ABR3SG50_9PEZI